MLNFPGIIVRKLYKSVGTANVNGVGSETLSLRALRSCLSIGLTELQESVGLMSCLLQITNRMFLFTNLLCLKYKFLEASV